jgi:hypothetical protein
MGLPRGNTTTVFYQYVVMIGGTPVGTIQRFNPSTERNLERVREIMGSNPDRDVVEIAFGRSDTQLTVERLELNKSAMMDILAPGEDFVDISQIVEPITIVEKKITPDGERVIEYQDCVAKSWSKTISVDTITVTESVTLWCTRVSKGGQA